MFESVELATLRIWLAQALDAHQALMTGAQVRSLAHGLKRIDYQRTETPKLMAYIQQLQGAIAAKESGATDRQSAIGVIF